MDPIIGAVKPFLLEEFLPGVPASELTESTPLITGGILDSIATLKLVAFLEAQFHIVVQPHESSIDYLDTLTQIAELVRQKQAGR
jgi:acyl carrier protein